MPRTRTDGGLGWQIVREVTGWPQKNSAISVNDDDLRVAYDGGTLVRRVNLHNDTRVTARQVFTTALKTGPHTLRIVKASGDVLRNDTITYTIAK